MYRSIVFAALLGGVGLGAWLSLSAHLKLPGLDFTALAAGLERNLQQTPSLQLQAEAVLTQSEQPHANDGQSLVVNAAVTTGSPATPTPEPQSNDLPIPGEWPTSDEVCGAWSVSEVGMEEILKEMVRRGWTPPSRSQALSATQRDGRPPIEALHPDTPASAILPDDTDATAGKEQPDLSAPQSDRAAVRTAP